MSLGRTLQYIQIGLGVAILFSFYFSYEKTQQAAMLTSLQDASMTPRNNRAQSSLTSQSSLTTYSTFKEAFFGESYNEMSESDQLPAVSDPKGEDGIIPELPPQMDHQTELEKAKAKFTKHLPPSCAGKERLLMAYLLSNTAIPKGLCDSLPTWEDVVHIYGTEPVFLKDCGNITMTKGYFPYSQVKISAMPNTGIGLLKRLIEHNIDAITPDLTHDPRTDSLQRKNIMWEVGDQQFYFRIVLVKDPYFWMESMCLTPADFVDYDGFNEDDCATLGSNIMGEFKAKGMDVHSYLPGVPKKSKPGETDSFNSPVEYWNKWVSGFTVDEEPDDTESTTPYIVIRYEDMLFHPGVVMEELSKCVGTQPHVDLTLPGLKKIEKKRLTKKPTSGLLDRDYINALAIYSSAQRRTDAMPESTLDHFREKVDPKLMDLLKYKHPAKKVKEEEEEDDEGEEEENDEGEEEDDDDETE